jgi:hypothetical protein
MKITGIVLLVVALIVLGLDIYNGIYGSYQYENQFESYWSLADKASTIPQKSQYIDRFISALEAGGFAGKFNAVMLQTPDNSFDKNLEAIKSLQLRLHEIEKMDVTSFQYQAAIQQITAQEQGEAKAMLHVFSGIWWKENHFFLWNWVGVLQVILMIAVVCVAGFLIGYHKR